MFKDLFSLKGRVALVTGGSRGIGKMIAGGFLAYGASKVYITARKAGPCEETAKELTAAYDGECIALPIDMATVEGCNKLAEEFMKREQKLDILVNNAGVFRDDAERKPSEQSLDTWRETFDTNVFGVVATTQAFLPLLKLAPSARIVNVSSILGSVAANADPASPIYDFKVPAYNVSKSAVNAWTVQLAHELRDTNIKVNAVHPGSVKTDMNSHGELEVADGAKTSVRMALLDDAGPNGGFVYFEDTLPW